MNNSPHGRIVRSAGKTLLLSTGFFASSLDNIFGVIFQPLFGRWSDKTHTRVGKRMPYIIVGIPICAVAFAMIPRMTTLWSLMVILPLIVVANFWVTAVCLIFVRHGEEEPIQTSTTDILDGLGD